MLFLSNLLNVVTTSLSANQYCPHVIPSETKRASCGKPVAIILFARGLYYASSRLKYATSQLDAID